MFKRTLNHVLRFAAGGLIALGLMAAAVGCDEAPVLVEMFASDSGYYDDFGGYDYGNESSMLGVQADNIDTMLGNFVDYGGGVSWTYQP